MIRGTRGGLVALGLAALLAAGCASGGGGAGASADWKLTAEPVAEGVLVSWTVPRASGRRINVEPRRVGPTPAGEERIKYSYGADDAGYDLIQLPPGRWVLSGTVNDGGQKVGPGSIESEPFVVDAAAAVVRPLVGADIGVDAPLGVPALVSVPAWRGDDALRTALEFAAEQAARAAFGEAWRLDDGDGLVRLLEARDDLARLLKGRDELAERPYPAGLEARLLLVCDLRPPVAAGDAPTLVVRLHELACDDHGKAPPRNGHRLPSGGSTLLAQAFVDVPDLEPGAGLLATRPLVTALRAALADVLAAPALARALPALRSDSLWKDGQEDLRRALRGIGAELVPDGADHARAERELVFTRSVELASVAPAAPADDVGAVEEPAAADDEPESASTATEDDGA